MGIDIALYKYEWNKLIDALLELGIEDKVKLEEIILCCGEKMNNTFYILNNELWEDFNCFYGLSSIIDSYFFIENSFDTFLELREDVYMTRDIYEIAEKFGIDLDA